MKELSLNILDVAKNSVTAGATLIEINISETDETMEIMIRDNGCGMDEEIVKSVTDPFYTTRTTRSVGLGVPLFKMEAEMTGGWLKVKSYPKAKYPEKHGTTVTALFNKKHIDFIGLGDMISTMTTLIGGSPDIDFLFMHKYGENSVSVDTREIRIALGGDISLDNVEILLWIEDSLKEEYGKLNVQNIRKG